MAEEKAKKAPPTPSEILVTSLNNRKQDVGLQLTTVKNWFSTGSPMLDYVIRPQAPLGQRGFPGGKWVDFYGRKHAGKSALAARTGACMQQQYGAHVAWMLGENGVEADFLRLCGLNLDPECFTIAAPFSLESLFICIENLIEAFHDRPQPLCIIVDSFSGLMAADYTMDEKSMKDGASRGAEAKAMHRGFRHGHMYYMNGTKILGIGIRHQTSNPDARFVGGDVLTHGSALDFHSWVQIKLTRKDFETDWGGKAAGSWLTAKIMKNKTGPLYGEVSMPFYADHGFDTATEQLGFLVARNALPAGRGAGRYEVAGYNIYKQELREKYYTEPAVRQVIDQLVMDCYHAGVKGVPRVNPVPAFTGGSVYGGSGSSPLDGLLR